MKNPFEVLNIPKSASDEDIKKAYRKMAVQHHPDKGGDPEKFKEINDAFSSLNKDGKHQNDPFQGQETNINDFAKHFFNNMHGGGGGFPFHFHNSGNFQQSVDVAITLEDIYKGKHVRVNNTEVNIPANTPINSRIAVPGSNIVIILRLRKHPIFEVENGSMNLIYKQPISLCEALLGFKGRIKHPNGTMLFMSTRAPSKYFNKVVGQNERLHIVNKGIPITPDGSTSDMFVIFDIQMPSTVDTVKYMGVIKEMLKWDVPDISPNANDIVVDFK